MKIVAKAPARAKKKAQSSRKGIPRFVFELTQEQRDELHALAQWLKANLKIKVSAATLVRIATADLINTYKNNIHKARDGAFHAKLRKHSLS